MWNRVKLYHFYDGVRYFFLFSIKSQAISSLVQIALFFPNVHKIQAICALPPESELLGLCWPNALLSFYICIFRYLPSSIFKLALQSIKGRIEKFISRLLQGNNDKKILSTRLNVGKISDLPHQYLERQVEAIRTKKMIWVLSKRVHGIKNRFKVGGDSKIR